MKNVLKTDVALKSGIFAIALIVMAVIPVYAQQYDSEKDFQIDWDPNVKDGIIIAKYIGAKKEVRIPPSIQNNPVTGIGYEAFKDNRNITKVTIPNSVTIIKGGAYSGAFSGCVNLTSINIPNGVTTIEEDAFRNSGITSITIPDSVTAIREGTFRGSDLTSVTIGNSVTSIEDQAFFGCTSLTSVTIPDSVISIGRSAFNNCTKLAKVIIGNGVTRIGNAAFGGCTSLTSVTIGNRVTTIGEDAFYKCTSLTSVIIPNRVTTIGEVAFYECTNLTSVTFQGKIDASKWKGGRIRFDGDLGDKYLASDGGPGTYTRFANGIVWRKTSSITPPPTGNLGAFTIRMEDNFQYAQGYEARIVDANLLNGHQITKGETYTLKVTYTTSRDLEGPVLVRLVDPSPEANWWRDLTPGDDSEFQIPASKAGEVVSVTVTLNTIASSTGSDTDKNIVVFTTNGRGTKGKQDSGVQKPFNIMFTEFVLTRIK